MLCFQRTRIFFVFCFLYFWECWVCVEKACFFILFPFGHGGVSFSFTSVRLYDIFYFPFPFPCLSLVQDDPFGNSDPFASAFPSSSASHSDGFDAFGSSWPASDTSHQVRGRGGQTGLLDQLPQSFYFHSSIFLV